VEVIEVISNLRTKSLMTDDPIKMQVYMDAAIRGLRLARLQRDMLLVTDDARAKLDAELSQAMMSQVPDIEVIP
jgi:hypothetical protein